MGSTAARRHARKTNAVDHTARQLHDDIGGALRRRSNPRSGRVARANNTLKRGALGIWKQLRRHPFGAVAALGVAGAAAASAVGVGELVFGAAVAIAAYKVLREGEPPMRAIEDIEHERA